MPYLLNVIYLTSLVLLAPWLLYKALTTGKYRRGLWQKFTGCVLPTYPSHLTTHPRVWFHGVSVGEIHLLRHVVAAFRKRHPDWDCVISTTTDTGFEEAKKHFPDVTVIFWPLDFSWAVRRALREVRPSLVVLAEGEMWPNFVRAAKQRSVPIAVINARMSPRSFRHYRLLGPLLRKLLARIDLLAVQTEAYAGCFRALGADPGRVHVTNSVKYDGVAGNRHNARTEELRRLLAVQPDDLVWIAGSTQPPEEEIAVDIYRRAHNQHANLRLLIVPRQKERFDDVAKLLERSGLPWIRRSQLTHDSPLTTHHSPVILVDSIGELGALWGLTDVAFVGGSLDGRRGGQNMIEPAAYGAAVVFGPHVWNFRDTVNLLLQGQAALQVRDAADLETVIRRLLADPSERACLGEAACALVLKQQGATERTIDLLDRLLPKAAHGQAA
jgi:3-deoxy-D-manno-octulosonic-acid transferase